MSCGFTASFIGAFSRPHAFGNRDGQGAAGLAALLLLAGAGVTLALSVTTALLAARLRRRRRTWPVGVSVALPVAAGLFAWAFAAFS